MNKLTLIINHEQLILSIMNAIILCRKRSTSCRNSRNIQAFSWMLRFKIIVYLSASIISHFWLFAFKLGHWCTFAPLVLLFPSTSKTWKDHILDMKKIPWEPVTSFKFHSWFRAQRLLKQSHCWMAAPGRGFMSFTSRHLLECYAVLKCQFGRCLSLEEFIVVCKMMKIRMMSN